MYLPVEYRRRSLDSIPRTMRGSPIWRQIKNSLRVLIGDFSWLPGNWVETRLKEDKTLKSPPLKKHPALSHILKWFNEQVTKTLAELSSWKYEGDWLRGAPPTHVPTDLESDWQNLVKHLKLKSLISQEMQDS